jgi:tetratricopeptide (TPR) repeat protein
MYHMDDKGFENSQPTMPPFRSENEHTTNSSPEETQPIIPGSKSGESNNDLGETMLSKVEPGPSWKNSSTEHTPPMPTSVQRRKSFSWLFIPVLGILAMTIIAFISGLGGYFSGISIRQRAETTQVAQVAQEQYQLGLEEVAQGEYQRARQRFEYVIELDPNFPGVTEKLSEVLLELNTTATPTLLPTATVTPTPDTRDVQEHYAQAQQYLLNKDWTNAIEALLSLRKADPSYQMVDVDGMLYLALRNQGVDKILKEADLEGGIYDLTLASKFGPLDTEAQGFLNWTGLYITGASFWEIDWEQAVNYFNQVAPQLPNLRDGLWNDRYRTFTYCVIRIWKCFGTSGTGLPGFTDVPAILINRFRPSCSGGSYSSRERLFSRRRFTTW